MLSSLIDALFIGIAVFLSLQLHWKVSQVRDVNGGKLVIKDMVKPVTQLLADTKTEMLPPMDDEEYERHMEETSERGQLLQAVKAKFAWKSKDNNSQSSDS